MIGREFTSTGRARWVRPVNSYTAMDLYRECEARGFEEMQIPVGTDRITNDLLRLQHRLRQVEGDLDDRLTGVERDVNEVQTDLTSLSAELESRE